MNRCAICQARAGVRSCPASGGYLCSACCGKHRQGFIHCPPNCRYLVAAERHLRTRLAQQLEKAWEEFEDLLAEREMDDLIPYMEALKYIIAQYLHRIPADDAEVQAALEYLDRSLSPIELIEPAVPKLGKFLAEASSSWIERGWVDQELLRKSANGLAAFVEHFAKKRPSSKGDESRRFVEALLGTYPKEEPQPPGLIARP